MAANVELEGLAAEWEQVRSIRDRIREHRGIFDESVAGKKLEANITGAAYHVDVLIPVLKMLVNSETGDVGMCSIPSLEAEWLAHVFNIVCLTYHLSHKALCWAPSPMKTSGLTCCLVLVFFWYHPDDFRTTLVEQIDTYYII